VEVLRSRSTRKRVISETSRSPSELRRTVHPVGQSLILDEIVCGSSVRVVPRASSIDVWMIVCLVFVFCALLEYAFVNVATRNGVQIRTPIVRNALPLQTVDRGHQLNVRTSVRPSVCLFRSLGGCTACPRIQLPPAEGEGMSRRLFIVTPVASNVITTPRAQQMLRKRDMRVVGRR